MLPILPRRDDVGYVIEVLTEIFDRLSADAPEVFPTPRTQNCVR